MLGISLGTNPNEDGVLLEGFFDFNSYWSGSFSPGAAVYVDVGTGYVSQMAPSGSGDYVRIIGHACVTDNVVHFNPDGTWIEVA